MRHTRFKPARRQGGFTLLEMLAVIVLLGIVATIVVRQVGGNVDKGKYGAGKAQLASLSMKIEVFGAAWLLFSGRPPLVVSVFCFLAALASWLWVSTVESAAPDLASASVASAAITAPLSATPNTTPAPNREIFINFLQIKNSK